MAAIEIDRAAVTERLDRVDDPELDRSIVDLQYVEAVRIDGSVVRIELVLPTAWCSPAFAWMMTDGAREEVEGLRGVEECTVELTDHMHAEEVNRGVNEGLRFEKVFDDADGGIEAVRRSLDEKARMARQYDAIAALTEADVRPEQIVSLRRTDLNLGDERALVSLADGGLVVPVPAEPLAAYVEKAETVGLVTEPTDRLFATADDEPIPVGGFERVQHRARLAKTNISGQGGICAELHEARNGVTIEEDE